VPRAASNAGTKWATYAFGSCLDGDGLWINRQNVEWISSVVNLFPAATWATRTSACMVIELEAWIAFQ
jgi:hypothetical protein